MRQLRTAPAAAWLRWQTRTWPWLGLHTRKLEWLAGGCWLGSKCSFEHGFEMSATAPMGQLAGFIFVPGLESAWHCGGGMDLHQCMCQ